MGKQSSPTENTAPYFANMVPAFAGWSDTLWRPLLRHVRLSGPGLETIQAPDGPVPVYVTPWIGQLDYLMLNWLFLEHDIPEVHYADGLRQPLVSPISHWSKLLRYIGYNRYYRPPAHPIRSGHMAELIQDQHPTLIRLRSSELYDDNYWLSKEEDPLQVACTAACNGTAIQFVPIQIHWDNNPGSSTRHLSDLLLGDRQRPGRIRKAWMLLRNYRHRLTIEFGEPIVLDANATPPELPQLRLQLLKQLKEARRGVTGPRIRPKRWVIDQTIHSDTVQQCIYDLAQTKGHSKDTVQLLAEEYAKEISADINFRTLELGARFFRWIFSLLYDGIVVDKSTLAELRRLAGQGPVILAPNHRSHIDYLLLSVLLHDHNVAVPHVAAGINMAFWPMGPLFRRWGAFFLRRSFQGNPLYRAVFAAYLKTLIASGHCIEFFIEGGRSRTGKALTPRYGMLAMFDEALEQSKLAQLPFVPVALTYDRVIEQKSYLSEIAGHSKRKESFWQLLRVRRIFRRRYGRVHVRFGEPIFHTSTTNDTTLERRSTYQQLAGRIMHQINRNIVVTPASLVATALLATPHGAQPTSAIHEHCQQLLQYLEWKKVTLADSLLHTPERAINEGLRHFAERRALSVLSDFDPVCYDILPERRHTIDLYKNTTMHYFVSLSCLSNLCLTTEATHNTLEHLTNQFQQLQILLSGEFVFSQQTNLPEHLTQLGQFLRDRNLLPAEASTWQPSADQRRALQYWAGLLRPTFEVYWAISQLGSQLGSEPMQLSDVVDQAFRYVTHCVRLGSITYPEARSMITVRSAIQHYVTLGWFQTPETDQASKLTNSSLITWISDHPQRASFETLLTHMIQNH